MTCGDCYWVIVVLICFLQAEDGIRDLVRSRGLGDVYKRQSLLPSCFPLVRRLGRARGKPILRVWSPSHCEAGPHVCIWPHFLVFDLRRSTSSSSCPSRFFPLPGPGMGAGSLMMKLVLFILFASSCRFWLTSCMTQSGPPGPLQDESYHPPY